MLVSEFIGLFKLESEFTHDRLVFCPSNSQYKLGAVSIFPSLSRIDSDSLEKNIVSAKKQIEKINKRSEAKVLGRFTKSVSIKGYDFKTWNEILDMEISSVDILHTSEDKYTPVVIYYIHLKDVIQE